MDVNKLEILAAYADGLSRWTESLVYAIENPEHVPADRTDMTATEWRDHCESMVVSMRLLVRQAYNAIERWQDV